LHVIHTCVDRWRAIQNVGFLPLFASYPPPTTLS